MPSLTHLTECSYCFNEAANVINPETLQRVDFPNVIINEVTKTQRTCVKCRKPFCMEHASPVDMSDSCYQCLPFEAASEMLAPLVSQSEDGDITKNVVHKGVHITPTGVGYRTLGRAIADMSDEELALFITEKSTQMHAVECQRDYLRVARSAAQLEQGDRFAENQKQLRILNRTLKSSPSSASKIQITGKTNGTAGKGSTKGIDVKNPLGITPEFVEFVRAQLAKQAATKVVVKSSEALTEANVVNGVPPPPTSVVGGTNVDGQPTLVPSPLELAREAEIEALLAGGEPTK